LVLPAFALFLPSCALFERGNDVRIVKKGSAFELLVNGKPFYIQGAGVGMGSGSRGENYLAMAKEMGANAVRTWGTDQGTQEYLDEAARLGLYVSAGIWINYADEKKTISYLGDNEYLRNKEKEALDYVRRFKSHPAVLMWNVGNECIFFTKDPAEREALCRFLEALTAKIKKIDPRHPVLYTSVNSLDLPYLKKYVPSLDLIGMNVYGSVIGAQSGWEALEFAGPYVVTEFGPLGPWDMPKDANGKVLEPVDATKAQQYRNHWSLIKERRGKNVGAFVFHLGETTQESMTYWNLNDSTRKKESYRVMQRLYTGVKPDNASPRIRGFEGLPTAAPAGSSVQLAVRAEDPDGDPLEYEYRASTSKEGILEYYVNVPVPIEVESGGASAAVRLPAEPGVYRVYAYAHDDRGNTAVASSTVRVE
jgi:hypothetical protein